MKSFKNFAVAALLIAIIVVVLQNTEAVETRLLFMTISMPRAVLLGLTLLIGVVIGLVLGTKLSAEPKKA